MQSPPTSLMDATFQAPLVATQQAAAVDRFFRGSESLYHAFKLVCIGQFPHDMQAIELAIKSGNADALRRHAHNLKSALAMLGFEVQENQALALELAACDGDLPAAALAWYDLGADLQRLTDSNQSPKRCIP